MNAPPADPTKFDIARYLTLINGMNRGKCNACSKSVPWARDRIISHKSSSCNVTPKEREFFNYQRNLRTAAPPTPHASMAATSVRPTKQQRTGKQECAAKYVDTMTVAERDQITEALCKVFYRTGIPFNVIESTVLADFIATIRPAYKAHISSRRSVAGVHLRLPHDKLKAKLRSWIADAPCFSLVSDGWSNSFNAHFVNFVVIVPGQSPFFYKSIPTSGVQQTGQVIAESISAVIEDLGASKCVSVVTDNAANIQVAWGIIETKYPNMFANGCGAHVINLLVKDLCALRKFEGVVEEVAFVVRFVNERQHILHYFNTTRQRLNVRKKLVLAAPTRWYTQYQSYRRLLDAKYAVLSLLVPDAATVMKSTRCRQSV